jgi:hypothetical protein
MVLPKTAIIILDHPHAATQINLSSHWMRTKGAGWTSRLCRHWIFRQFLWKPGARRNRLQSEYGGLANYAYHLDAVKFAKLLQ